MNPEAFQFQESPINKMGSEQAFFGEQKGNEDNIVENPYNNDKVLVDEDENVVEEEFKEGES